MSGNGKTGNSTPCHPEPLNRSSQKVAHVITSCISTDVQNLVAIPPGVSFPRMREIAHQNVYSASFFRGSANSLQPRRLNGFSLVIRQTTRFCTRMCLFGVRRQKINIYTRNSRKTAILGPILTGLRNFLTENRFTMGVLLCKLPLIVVVAP